MHVVVLARRAWIALLAAMPRQLLRRLDAWAQRQAQARADRRRRQLQSSMPRG